MVVHRPPVEFVERDREQAAAFHPGCPDHGNLPVLRIGVHQGQFDPTRQPLPVELAYQGRAIRVEVRVICGGQLGRISQLQAAQAVYPQCAQHRFDEAQALHQVHRQAFLAGAGHDALHRRLPHERMPGNRIEHALRPPPERHNPPGDGIVHAVEIVQRLVQLVKVMQFEMRGQTSYRRMSPCAEIGLAGLCQQVPGLTRQKIRITRTQPQDRNCHSTQFPKYQTKNPALPPGNRVP